MQNNLSPSVAQSFPSKMEGLLEVAEQMSVKDLDVFLDKLLLVRAKRNVRSLSKQETELLLKINESLTADEWARHDELVEKRRAENITPKELKELIKMTDRLEAMNVRRLRNVHKLAKIRGVPFEQLTKQLGIYKSYNVI